MDVSNARQGATRVRAGRQYPRSRGSSPQRGGARMHGVRTSGADSVGADVMLDRGACSSSLGGVGCRPRSAARGRASAPSRSAGSTGDGAGKSHRRAAVAQVRSPRCIRTAPSPATRPRDPAGQVGTSGQLRRRPGTASTTMHERLARRPLIANRYATIATAPRRPRRRGRLHAGDDQRRRAGTDADRADRHHARARQLPERRRFLAPGAARGTGHPSGDRDRDLQAVRPGPTHRTSDCSVRRRPRRAIQTAVDPAPDLGREARGASGAVARVRNAAQHDNPRRNTERLPRST